MPAMKRGSPVFPSDIPRLLFAVLNGPLQPATGRHNNSSFPEHMAEILPRHCLLDPRINPRLSLLYYFLRRTVAPGHADKLEFSVMEHEHPRAQTGKDVVSCQHDPPANPYQCWYLLPTRPRNTGGSEIVQSVRTLLFFSHCPGVGGEPENLLFCCPGSMPI